MIELENSIRLMKKEDIEECITMTLESFDDYENEFDTIKEEFEESFDKEWWGLPKYFVFENEGKILGMGGYSLSRLDWDSFEMFWLCVRKEYKGHGIGSALTKHREQDIIKNSSMKTDITIIFSCTNSVSEYHKKQGYKIILEKAGGKEVLMGKTFLK